MYLRAHLSNYVLFVCTFEQGRLEIHTRICVAAFHQMHVFLYFNL
jgi:hypothetical protein